jgi:uncharacterized protein YoxC
VTLVDITDLINSMVFLVIGVMVAAVLWKISQFVDALKENIKEAKKT